MLSLVVAFSSIVLAFAAVAFCAIVVERCLLQLFHVVQPALATLLLSVRNRLH